MNIQLDQHLTQQLYDISPRLYRGRHRSAQDSSMCWGFECGPGWFDLLERLSQELNIYLEAHPDVQVEAVQVKSKFGLLEFHLSESNQWMEQSIAAAREMSKVTCELTGRPGRLCVGPRRWLMTLCEEKSQELGYQPVERS